MISKEYGNGMQRITHDKISETALQSIKLYILDNNLKAGDLLPSETELSGTLGISRASIREAFRSLEALGIIVTAQGKGRYIRDFNYEAMVENLSYNLKIHVDDFRQIIDVRMALEESFLKKSMEILTEDDYKELELLLERMQRQVDDNLSEEELVKTHTLFHQKLYAKLNNNLLESLIGMFSTFQRFLTVMKRYKTSNYVEFIALHRDLITMLRSHDPSQVHDCLKQHFKDVINWSSEHQDHMI
ncbi:MAG: FadR/GntR family transcriptional regulator [Sphaerochaetaceae bacterium]